MNKRIIGALTIAFSVLLVCVLIILVINNTDGGAGSPSEQPSSGQASASGIASDEPSNPGSDEPSEYGSESTGSGESPSETESSEETGKKVISFLACPDNIIHPSVYYSALRSAALKAGVEPDYKSLQTADYDFLSIYDNVAPLIRDADISYINVETLIGGNDNKISGYPTFNSPEAAGEALITLGFDIYNLAHNHMLDSYNDKYLINCNRFFTERGKTTIGYYESKDVIDDIVIIEEQGIKIALLAYTYGTNGITLSSSSSTYLPIIGEELMTRQVNIAKEKADFIIASVHWGTEDIYSPVYEQRSAAQKLVDLGVDVIIGMHPHVIQEAKWVERSDGSGRTFLVYSLGNFVSGMYGGKNALGAMLSFNIVSEGDGSRPYADEIEIIPTVCHYTKESAVNKDDTGFRNFKIYLVEDYSEELASAHGCKGNVSKMSIVDPLLDKNFSKASLEQKINEIFPKEFLPEYYN